MWMNDIVVDGGRNILVLEIAEDTALAEITYEAGHV
jgi:hypothetical protein